MRVLGIDTHGPFGGAAVWCDGEAVAELLLSVRATHSEQLLPAIEAVLTLAGAAHGAPPVDAVAVAVGPGSYTGLRIGVVTAKSLAYAWRVPVVGVSTLEALALQNYGVAPVLVGMVSSRGDRLFAAAYRYATPPAADRYVAPVPLVAPGHYTIREFLQAVAALGEPAACAGDAVCGFEEEIRAQLGNRWVQLPAAWTRLRSATVASLGALLLASGRAADPFTLAPEYLRMSEAEIRWQSRPKQTKSKS